MKRYLLAGLGAVFMASSANAAVTLTGVTVNGVTAASTNTGTVWDTTKNSYYAVFVQPGFGGTVLNPKDQAINTPLSIGENDFTIAGQSWTIESLYKITLLFSNGGTVSQVYNRLTDMDSAGTGMTAGGVTYRLDGFSWGNSHVNSVSAFTNTPDKNGAKSDFKGSFSLIATAVPEPATWAMMLAGFGMIGFAARRRAKPSVRVTDA